MSGGLGSRTTAPTPEPWVGSLDEVHEWLRSLNRDGLSERSRRNIDWLAARCVRAEEAIREHREKLGGSVHTPQAQHVWAKATVRLWEVLR